MGKLQSASSPRLALQPCAAALRRAGSLQGALEFLPEDLLGLLDGSAGRGIDYIAGPDGQGQEVGHLGAWNSCA